jgi:beta-N-acetylhexosaminidase
MRSKLLAVMFSLILFTGFNNMAFSEEIPLKEKIGQMLLIGFKGMELHDGDAIVQAILKHQVGGVILFDYDFSTKTFEHNIKSPAQLKKLTGQLQDYTRQAAQSNHQEYYPLLIGLDYEGGKVNRLKEGYGFPKTLSAADIATLSLDEAKQYAEQMAVTLQQNGINLNFAPVVDVNVNPECPVIGKFGRSFSSDPKVVSDYAGLFSKAFYEHGVLCSYKHFPGHGSSNADSHMGFVDVTSTWMQYELDPYKTLLQQSYGCSLVMTAHVVHYGLDSQGYPASLSRAITHDLLREQLNFHGTVITDDLQMKAITDNYGTHEAVKLAVNAGADILVFGNQLAVPQNPQEIIEMIYQDVKNGEIPESRIDEAYQHVMQLKEQLQKSALSLQETAISS